MTHIPKRTYLKDYKAPAFAIDKVYLDFDIQQDCTYVNARLDMRKLDNTTASLTLDGEALELISLKINGRSLKDVEYIQSKENLLIKEVPQQFCLESTTRIYPDKNSQLTGLYLSGIQYCTQCEAEGFRHMTYFLDRPDIMAIYQTRISADKKRFPTLLSNGNLIDQGEDKERHWALWEDPFKKPSYLFAMVAGDFDLLEDVFHTASGRRVDLRIYVDKGDLPKARHAMEALKKAMRWDEVNYQREYDLSLYLVVSIRDFNAGAMENKGLNIFNAQYILADKATATDEDYLNIESVIAHEYFHNWTGNRITCRDWFQLSLKEGLTIFRDQSFSEDTFSKSVARIREVTSLRMRQFPEDASPIAHPVQPDSYIEISNFYSATIYNKGAEVIRMIRTLLGEKTFKEGMQWYFNHYDGMAVTIDEFIHAFATVSGRDFTQFKRWYQQSGTPIVKVSDDYDAEKKIYQLHFEQSTPPSLHGPEKELLVIPVLTALLTEQGDEIPIPDTLLTLTEKNQSFIFKDMPSRPVPSLLRNFSAPVKLEYSYTPSQISMLAQFDQDPFNRFEISQRYTHQILAELMTGQRQILPEAMTESFNRILSASLKAEGEAKCFLTELLTCPSEKLVAEKMPVIQSQLIRQSRDFLLEQLALASEDNFLAVYSLNEKKSPARLFHFSLASMADRGMKNIALFYLIHLKKEAYIALGFKQLEQALGQNMTDLLAALRCLVNVNEAVAEDALSRFYHQWQDVPEALDKWFAVQGLSKLDNTLGKIQTLVHHPRFSFKNPNQVYALIGSYCQHNLALFHDKEGKSYQFLTDIVLELNQTNPQLASAMVKPLLNWRRYDSSQQALMHQEIERILAAGNLSKGLYELVKTSV